MYPRPTRFRLILFIFFMFSSEFSLAARLVPGQGAESFRPCALFPNGVQDPSERVYRVSDLQPVLLRCTWQASKNPALLAIRDFKVGTRRYFLTVNPDSLLTRITEASCLSCASVTHESIMQTPYGKAVERLTQEKLKATKKTYFVSAGLKHDENAALGSVVSADLCPSNKPLDRSFFLDLERLQNNIPVALAISGYWLKKHPKDFAWLKSEIHAQRLNVTWVNHSFFHTYKKEQPAEDNYLLSAKADIRHEILATERLLIENGITPSVFFRFPALVSNEKLMNHLKQKMLLPVASDAWLAIGQEPKEGSIILVHANGNETRGLARFKELVNERKLPLPVFQLEAAPYRTLITSHEAPAVPQQRNAGRNRRQ